MTSTRNVQIAGALTARSVIASTLLGTVPPVLPARVLVRSGSLFGISEGTVRVALTRMLAAGELTTDGEGRYELVGHLRSRQHRQAESRVGVRDSGAGDAWDGNWEMGVVIADGRSAAERNELRIAMRRLRYGELREGCWLRPRNLSQDRQPEDRLVAQRWMMGMSTRPQDPATITNTLWDLPGWALDAQRLEAQMKQGVTELTRAGKQSGAPDSLAEWFTVNAAALRHFQADPLLPVALEPKRWPGRRLRSTFETFDAAFLERWGAWLRS